MDRKQGRKNSALGTARIAILVIALAGLQLACNMMGVQEVESAPRVAYRGPQVPVAVGEFVNRTGVDYQVQRTGAVIQTGAAAEAPERLETTRDPFGTGMRDQLITALAQTGVFQVKRSEAGAHYLLEGAITEYQPSEASFAGGIGRNRRRPTRVSDPSVGAGSILVQVLTDDALAGSVDQDHVAIDVRLIDLRTNSIVATNAIQAKPKDLGFAMNLLPGGTLIDAGAQMQTPMQKAVRACLAKAAAWAAEEVKVRQIAAR